MNIELKKLRDLVGSKIFSVSFTKKDGSIREMTCRLGVKKHLKGGELAYIPDDLNYIVVFDMIKEDYRTINVNTLKRIKFEGITYDL